MEFEVNVSVDEIEQTTGGNGGNGGYTSNMTPEDWNAMREYEMEVVGEGTESRIGVVTMLYDLGLQDRGEGVIPVTDPNAGNHDWRFEKVDEKDPNSAQRDSTARKEMRVFKKQKQECIVYKKPDCQQFAVAIDFPELMVDRSEWFEGQEPTPYRIILGENGYIPVAKGERRPNILARPYNLNEIDVNRNKDGVQRHYAIAKNSQLYKLADICGVLDDNGNFHANDRTKLLGKVCMFDVEGKWIDGVSKTTGNPYHIPQIDAEPTGRLSKRDEAFFKSDIEPTLKPEMFGYLSLGRGAQCATGKVEDANNLVKSTKASVVNTMMRAKDFEGSKLYEQFKTIAPNKLHLVEHVNVQQNNTASQSESKPIAEAPVSEPDISDAPDWNDFDDSIPF